MTALMPVGVERMTGRPSSAARSRAWARCCGGPQRPNQASLDGLKMKSGRVRGGGPSPPEKKFLEKLEAALPPPNKPAPRGGGAAGEEGVAGGGARRAADGRQ